MNLLLDTHALLWWLLDDEHLSPRARSAISNAENGVLVSSASGWEIATKHRVGKLAIRPAPGSKEKGFDPSRLPELLQEAGFDVLPVTMEHALEAGLLHGSHRDPFDRMLIAQSRIEGLPVVTRDPVFDEYGVEVLW